MFRKILIANRAEIACRIAATARRMGVRTVAVYSDADAHAAHVAACDEAVYVGGSAPQDSYLRADRIVAAALQTGAQAIHPGYGFLSENADFAQACTDAGLVFIGPPPSAIRAMGLKSAAKQCMEQAGVPLVPGYHGDCQEAEFLQQQAQRTGYPVLIKASAGGGGKGMRWVGQPAEFAAALASCQREAASSFGNAAVLVEKYVQRPRHIEVQVFGDTHGDVVYLWERDCSVQRRHQKMLEEAPAPGMTAQLRERMGQAAVAAAKAVGYVGAGTVEFIVEQPEGYAHPEAMRFFFMEMNTRLQVEHPVTEAITGLDLVEWQLRVAAGQPLPLRQTELRLQGHAIEARICAENPDNGFLPTTGTLQVYRTPSGTRFAVGDVRVDSGVREGDAISPYYDSMLAKLIVHGDTRAQALARLDATLAQMRIVGVANNVQFLRKVLASDSFATAQLDTALLQREQAHLQGEGALPVAQAVAVAVAHQLHHACTAAAHDADPFARCDGWHSHGHQQRSAVWLHRAPQGEQHWVARWTYTRSGPMWLAIEPSDTQADGADASGCGAGEALSWQPVQTPDGTALQVRWGMQHITAQVWVQGDSHHVFAPAGSMVLQHQDPLSRGASSSTEGGSLCAPMPGKVLAFKVQVGERVAQGQPVAVLEAMKMEHTIAAPADGVVQALLYAVGDTVSEGASLLQMQA